MTKSVGVHEAKTHLSRLIAEVEAGEEIAITRRGKEVARIVPGRQPAKRRRFGRFEGEIVMSDDFDAPLPPEIQAAFDGRGT